MDRSCFIVQSSKTWMEMTWDRRLLPTDLWESSEGFSLQHWVCLHAQFNQAMLNIRLCYLIGIRSLSQFTCMEKNILQEKRKNVNHFKSLHWYFWCEIHICFYINRVFIAHQLIYRSTFIYLAFMVNMSFSIVWCLCLVHCIYINKDMGEIM